MLLTVMDSQYLVLPGDGDDGGSRDRAPVVSGRDRSGAVPNRSCESPGTARGRGEGYRHRKSF